MSDLPEPLAPSTPSTPGEWLRQERIRQSRTVQQIASDLHLGAYMIEAMENNQFAVLGAPVFARGHLRKYATLLGLPIERVQELYQALSDRPRDEDPVPVIHRATEPSIPMSPDSKERRALKTPASWTLAIAGGVLVLAGLVAWLFHVGAKHEQQERELSGNVADLSSASAPVPPSDAPPNTTDNSTNAGTQATAEQGKVIAKDRSAPTSNVVPAERTTAPAARGKIRLRFSFTQESWVEVYDTRGTRMLYDVGQPGQTRSVDVDAPAQIVLGLAAAVNTEVNGRAITVPTRRIVNQVAHFTVGVDGAAQ